MGVQIPSTSTNVPAPAVDTVNSGNTISQVFVPQVGRPVSLTAVFTGTGTIKVQRAHDYDPANANAAQWNDMTLFGAATAVFTANCDEKIEESAQSQEAYRVFWVSGSGSAAVRLGH